MGGRPVFGNDGYYYVLIEDDHPGVPGQALVEAMQVLNALPQVDFAGPELIFESLEGYRRPYDGQG